MAKDRHNPAHSPKQKKLLDSPVVSAFSSNATSGRFVELYGKIGTTLGFIEPTIANEYSTAGKLAKLG
jgi:hypothetical protein